MAKNDDGPARAAEGGGVMDKQRRENIQRALDRTIRAYGKLIANVDEEKYKWDKYGEYLSCILCRAVGVRSDLTTKKCIDCPLANGSDHTPCFNDTLQIFRYSLDYSLDDNEMIIKSAIRRLNWIKRTAKKNGWEVA